MERAEVDKTTTKISSQNWSLIVMLGLAGQLAWNVENSWFNTFVFDRITPDPKVIAWMVGISAITATLATLFMGTLSDRLGKRKPFILIGYILWGLSTALFPTTAYINEITFAIFMVVLLDAVMTFLGATANDAAFNAWVTDITDKSNRGLAEGVLNMFPVVAAIVGIGLSGMIIDHFGYFVFFYSLGAIVLLIGIVSGMLLQEAPDLKASHQPGGNIFRQVAALFRPSSVRANKELFIIFGYVCVTGIAYNVIEPFKMIYLNNYLEISKSMVGLIALPIVAALLILAIPLGKLADRGYGTQIALLSPLLFFVGQSGISLTSNLVIIIICSVVAEVGKMAIAIALGAWAKNLMPADQRGQFLGVRMIFLVMLPMVIGPAFGAFLIESYGIPTELNGADGFIPTPVLFQGGAVIGLLPLIFLYWLHQHRKNQPDQETATLAAVKEPG